MDFFFDKYYSRTDGLGIAIFSACLTENRWDMTLIGIGVVVFTIALTHYFGD